MSVLNEPLPELARTSPSQLRTPTLLVAIGLSSFSALLLELTLTRLFSVVLFYHFAFLAISIALLGLGAGGVLAHLRKPWLDQFEVRNIAALCTALGALVIPVVLEIVLHLPVSLELTKSNFLRLSVIYSISSVPFFLVGLAFSVIFARESARIPRMYGADLVGGALACLAVVPLLNWVGAPNAILFAALASAAAATVWSASPRTRSRTIALAGILVLGIVLNHAGQLADIIWAKGKRRENVEFAAWNAISRVEVNRQKDGARVIVIDADANTYIMNAEPGAMQGSTWQHQLMAAPPAVVNALRPHGDYAIIGPGGGVDVLRAVASGSPHVTGIEINPIIANTIMRARYADFAYHLYQRPEVNLEVADGRSFIRNVQAHYDVVEMTLVDTWASTAAGAFALSENNLYTMEAFREYFAHLKPDGIVAITRWEFPQPREALRVASVASAALHQMGITDVSHNFIVVAQDKLAQGGINVAVLAKKTAFTAQEEGAVEQYVARYPPMQILYAPSTPGNNPFSQLIMSNDPYRFSASYDYNVSPVTDNAPFFFFTLKPARFLHAGAEDNGVDWKVNLGVAVLAMLLVISVMAVVAFLILPLLIRGNPSADPPQAIFYFVAIGLGYILVEVAFIQRFVLFLGHPTYALTVVIFLMLLSSGAGSVVSRSCLANSAAVWIALTAIIAALALYVWLLPRLLDHFVGAAFVSKLVISGYLLVPLGVAMGMPFPTGLRALAEGRPRSNSIEWAWAMNAAASVLGSVLAIVLAIQLGLNATLACGAGAYAAALLLSRKLHFRPSLV
jgi:spermidine synthase